MKLTLKQEKFCLAYHASGNASGAYREAYECDNMLEATINNNAYMLKNDSDVKARLEELLEEDRKRNAVTIDSITKELEDARKKAMKEGKGASAAVSASLGKAKLHGLLIDKSESNSTTTIRNITDDQLKDKINALFTPNKP